MEELSIQLLPLTVFLPGPPGIMPCGGGPIMGIIGGPPIGGAGNMPGLGGPPIIQTCQLMNNNTLINTFLIQKHNISLHFFVSVY